MDKQIDIKETENKPELYTLLGNVVFSKDLFIETINEIEKQHRHDYKCSEAFSVIFPNDYISNYENHWLQNQLVKVLQIAMNDNHKDSWIDYFISETKNLCLRKQRFNTFSYLLM